MIDKIMRRHKMRIHRVSYVYNEIATRMLNHLEFTKLNPRYILDIGCGLGFDKPLLRDKYSNSNIYGIDCAFSLLTGGDNVCGDINMQNFKNNSFDLLWSNLTIPYLKDYRLLLHNIINMANHDALLMLSGFGNNSLHELRKIGFNTSNFIDIAAFADQLLHIGFIDPVIDVDCIKLQYDNLLDILLHIRSVGCGALFNSQKSSYVRKYLNQSLDSVTLEIFFVHAWVDKKSCKLHVVG